MIKMMRELVQLFSLNFWFESYLNYHSILETDCLKLQRNLTHSVEDRSYMGLIIKDGRGLLDPSVCVNHMKHIANQVAHVLVRVVGFDINYEI